MRSTCGTCSSSATPSATSSRPSWAPAASRPWSIIPSRRPVRAPSPATPVRPCPLRTPWRARCSACRWGHTSRQPRPTRSSPRPSRPAGAWTAARMVEGRRVWMETASGAIALGAGPAFMLVTLHLATAALGAGAWGAAMAALTWSTTLAALFSLSLQQIAVHEAARSSPPSRVLVGTAGGLALVLGAGGILAGLLLWWLTGGAAFGELPFRLLVAALAVLPFTLWVTVSQGLFQSRGQVLRYSGLVFTSATVNAALLVAFLLLARRDSQVVLLAALGGAVAASVPALVLLWRGGGRPSFDGTMARRWLKSAPSLHLAVVGYQMFSSADLLIIHHVVGPVQAAWYRVATLVMSAFLLLPAAMASSLFSLGARLGPIAAWPLQRRRTLEAVGLMTVARADRKSTRLN